MPFSKSYWYFYHKSRASIFLLASWGVYCLGEGVILEEKPEPLWINNIIKGKNTGPRSRTRSTPGPAVNLGKFVLFSGS